MEETGKNEKQNKLGKPAKPGSSRPKEKRAFRRPANIRFLGNKPCPGLKCNVPPVQMGFHCYNSCPKANFPLYSSCSTYPYDERPFWLNQPPCPYKSHPVCHSPAFGVVSTSVFNGTTFYHYHSNAGAGNHVQQGGVYQDDEHLNCDFSVNKKPKDNSSKDAKRKDEAVLSTSHQGPPELSPPDAIGRCSTFTPISSVSSRSSSPFLLSTRSSARDSGLVSTASTDDDASLVHAATRDEVETNLVQLIKQVAEDIMLDENCSTDSYLFRQMKRNPEGFVSIKLLGSSKKIKKLIGQGEENLLLLALLKSEKLKVNKANTKVQRRFPPLSLSTPSKKTTSLVLIDPKNIDGIADVTQIMSVYGEISQIRIIRPGRLLPLYLKGYSNVIPQLGKVLCVTVEFDEESSLLKAYQSLLLEDKMSVLVLGSNAKRFSFAPVSTENKSHERNEGENYGSCESALPKTAVTRLDSETSIESKDSGVYPEEFQLSPPQEKNGFLELC